MDSHATDQCNDKHACGRREQLRNPDRHRELEAEERDLGGVFVNEDNAATADRITRVGDFPICVLSPPRKRHAPRGAPPSKSLLAHFPGLDSYLSEVDRFALDMRKRSSGSRWGR
jgi:hypothetical protein